MADLSNLHNIDKLLVAPSQDCSVGTFLLCLSFSMGPSCQWTFFLTGAGNLPFSEPTVSLIDADCGLLGSGKSFSVLCFFLFCLNWCLNLSPYVTASTVSVCLPCLFLAVSSFSLSLSVFLSSSYSVTYLGMEFLPHPDLEWRRWSQCFVSTNMPSATWRSVAVLNCPITWQKIVEAPHLPHGCQSSVSP